MKKLLAMAVVAVGMMVGASSAAASTYPTDFPEITAPPASVEAGASFTLNMRGLAPGDVVSVTWLGTTTNYTAAAAAGLYATGNATVSFTLTAPNEPGTYPLSIRTAEGFGKDYQIKVVAKGTGGGAGGDMGNKPGGKLPATGSNLVMPGAGLGLAAVAGGLGLLFVSKRRRTASV